MNYSLRYRSYFLCSYLPPTWPSFFTRGHVVAFEEACFPDSMIVPEAATTVLCTPDDGRDGRPKHVE